MPEEKTGYSANPEFESVQTDQQLTKSREAHTVVWSDGTDFFADADTNVASGSDGEAVLQSAIDNAPQNARVAIHVSAAPISVNSIVLKNQITLSGPSINFEDNDLTILKAESGAAGPVIDVSDPSCAIENVKITGNEGSGNGETGIDATGSKTCVVRTSVVENVDGDGVIVGDVGLCRDVRVQSAGGDAFLISGADASINGGTAANGTVGVRVDAASAEVSGMEIFVNDNNGIVLTTGGDDSRISDCRINTNGARGIFSDGVNVSVEGCHILNNDQNQDGNAGVFLSSNNSTISDCHIYDNQSTTTQERAYVVAGTAADCRIDEVVRFGNASDPNDFGTRTRVNGVAVQALGGSAPSTPSNWERGDVVEDKDNPGDAYIKLPNGFSQIST